MSGTYRTETERTAVEPADRGLLLLTSGTDDHVVPLKVTNEVAAMYSKSPAEASTACKACPIRFLG